MQPFPVKAIMPLNRCESNVALLNELPGKAPNRPLVTLMGDGNARSLDIRWNSPWTLIMVLVWAAASIGGFMWLSTFTNSPGQSGIVPREWPATSRLVLDSNRANLVLMVHPRCPCSRATINELAEIMAQCENAVAAHVLWLKPQSSSDGWEVTDLWHVAAAIPGVRMLTDDDGVEARQFGAVTSGQVALFDRQGHMVFHGGITVSRGHRGENPGRAAVMDWLTKGTSSYSEFCVFGCPLFADRGPAKNAKGTP